MLTSDNKSKLKTITGNKQVTIRMFDTELGGSITTRMRSNSVPVAHTVCNQKTTDSEESQTPEAYAYKYKYTHYYSEE